MSEFSLIRHYFYWNNLTDTNLRVANGDDAAVISIPTGYELAVSVDTSNKGIHFPEDTPAHAIGFKALAVNLSDMAAMGAIPRWFTLSLSLPDYNEAWLQDFTQGLRDAAHPLNLSLIGGDTTRGALSISIQIMGLVPQGRYVLRSDAKVGDAICVTGNLGDAAAGLAYHQQQLRLSEKAATFCMNRLNYPSARFEVRDFLLNHAHACMDVSDGLNGDIRHILQASGVGAEVDAACLPYSTALLELPEAQRQSLALSGGDDYELLFTIAPEKLPDMRLYFNHVNLAVTQIGLITGETNHLRMMHLLDSVNKGFDHFK